jgi:Predicted membrane protein
VSLLEDIDKLYKVFRDSELPKTRKEFESRAILYYILTDFEKFLLLKRDFYVEHGEVKDTESLKQK